MEKLLSEAANAAQLLGLKSMTSVFAVITLVLAWRLVSEFWAWRGWHVPTTNWIVRIQLGLFVTFLMLWIVFARQEENLVRNPQFVNDTRYWGTGYIETLVTNGNFPANFTKQYPLVLSGQANAFGRRDAAVYPRGGYASFFIDHKSGRGDHVWSSLSQSITGLKQDTDYVPAFKIKSDHLEKKALFLTLDTQWRRPHRYAPPGQYNWQRIEFQPFNTGKKDFLEFRIVIQDQARIWLADFELYERPKP